MLSTLIDCSRLILDSPWLMLLGFAVVVLPGGLLLSPVFVSKIKRARAVTVVREAVLIEPITATRGYESNRPQAKAKPSYIQFVPSVGKVQ